MDAGEHVTALDTPIFKDASMADVIVHLGCKVTGKGGLELVGGGAGGEADNWPCSISSGQQRAG